MHGRQHPVVRMKTLGIIPQGQPLEHLDIVEDILPGVGSGCVGLSPDPLRLEKMEEALRDRIVVTVSPSSHTRDQIMGVEKRSPLLT